MISNQDQYYMGLALKEAQKAYAKDEVPVGCVIVQNNQVIARAHNMRQLHHDVLGHAEIRAIKKATKKLNSWILEDATLYVTLEPCLMCAGAILQARIKRVVFATLEPKFGAIQSVVQIFNDEYHFNHHVIVDSGVCQEEASTLLKTYFQNKRHKR